MSKKERKKKSTSTLVTQPLQDEKLIPEPEPDVDTTDQLILKIFSLRISDRDLGNFVIKVTFQEHLLVHAIIKPIDARDKEPDHPIIYGSMSFDPADYAKMCFFADYPLVAEIERLRYIVQNSSHINLEEIDLAHDLAQDNQDHGDVYTQRSLHISCCNVDILPIFTDMEDDQKICIKKRMEPMVRPSALKRKSWDTLPLLTMELTVKRNPLNKVHHKVLRNANWMKITLMASYNMFIPFEQEYVYTAASKAPSQGEEDENVGLVTFSQGYKNIRFDSSSFFPKWESLRGAEKLFTKGDQKVQFQREDLQNESEIDLPFYLNAVDRSRSVVWGSFHRTLILKGDRWLWKHIRKHKWPFELHIQGGNGGFSLMAPLNLFPLLYPGEQIIRLVVPLQWINGETVMWQCGCDLLLTPLEKPPSDTNELLGSQALAGTKGLNYASMPESYATSDSSFMNMYKPTGADDNDAFVVLEVQLGRPLTPISIPPTILIEDLGAMLTTMELEAPRKRICTGRGQLEHDWQKTVRSAANSLRKVPYYGPTEFCTFNRQLSETRTRVELTTSCWQDAAVFVNNQFVVQQYQHSDAVFEELVMMAHACLMKSASNTLLRTDQLMVEMEPALRAARHARQMQDTSHAMEIYLRLVVENPRNADYWRELSTVVKEIDKDCARVCLDRAILLNARHPLTLLSKGAMLFEENPLIAEPFFIAVLTLHPTWSTVWTIASAYFYERELFHLATVTMNVANEWRYKVCVEEGIYRRGWEKELGDWWDATPILPGMSLYYDAADLLIRLRAVSLAEVCIARVLSVSGDSPQYYHLVSLCCRLRGEFEQAKCHIDLGLEKFGEINYLRSLEAEIQHKLGNFQEAIESFGKVANSVNAYTALMSLSSGANEHSRASLLDLTRQSPSAYAWVALAEDWLGNPPAPEKLNTKNKVSEEGHLDEGKRKNARLMKAKASAIACAIQALKIDRQAGRAWATLGKFVKPKAKRIYCLNMAVISGWRLSKHDFDLAEVSSQHSFCHDIGTSVRECRCNMCDKTKV